MAEAVFDLTWGMSNDARDRSCERDLPRRSDHVIATSFILRNNEVDQETVDSLSSGQDRFVG